ncbi:MAG: Crp/Fnr family transcriptional regulator [Burkholderiaceae bacterium]
MNVQQLIDAIEALDATDALPCKLPLDDWKQIAPYLSMRFLQPGDTLIRAGETERVLFILTEGELHVRLGNTVLAALKPGTVVGEGAFFSGATRSADVVAALPGMAWALSWERYEKLSRRLPRLALVLTQAFAAVLAVRMREAILVDHFAG